MRGKQREFVGNLVAFGKQRKVGAVAQGDLKKLARMAAIGIGAGPDDGKNRGAAGEFDFALAGVGFAGELPDGGIEPAGLDADFAGEFGRGVDAPAGREAGGFGDVRGEFDGGIGKGFAGDELLEREALAEQFAGVVGRKADGFERFFQALGIVGGALGVLGVADDAADEIGEVVDDARADGAGNFQRGERGDGMRGFVHKIRVAWMGSSFKLVELGDNLIQVGGLDAGGGGVAFGQQGKAMAVLTAEAV